MTDCQHVWPALMAVSVCPSERDMSCRFQPATSGHRCCRWRWTRVIRRRWKLCCRRHFRIVASDRPPRRTTGVAGGAVPGPGRGMDAWAIMRMYDGQPDDGATFNKRGIVVARPTYVAGRPDGPSGPARAGPGRRSCRPNPRRAGLIFTSTGASSIAADRHPAAAAPAAAAAAVDVTAGQLAIVGHIPGGSKKWVSLHLIALTATNSEPIFKIFGTLRRRCYRTPY